MANQEQIVHETYRLERLLGVGGMAQIYEVSHVRIPRRFALKVINLYSDEDLAQPLAPRAWPLGKLNGEVPSVDALPDPLLPWAVRGPNSPRATEVIGRFRQEAELQAKLDHPNIVGVLDWNVLPNGLPYLLMELLVGEDLGRLIARCGALPFRIAVSILAQIAAGLEYAHNHHVLHRDLKPSNIFLCKNNIIPYHVKILDFGVAKAVDMEVSWRTGSSGLVGTPAYMAPEQICGSIACPGPLSDQFSLGLVLYEMLSGKSAFFRPGEPIYATLRNVVEREPAPLSNPRLNQAVMRALKKNPAERYPNLSEFVAEILRCSTEPISLAQLPERTARQRVFSWQELASFELPSEATTYPMKSAPAMAVVSEEIPFEETATIRRKKLDLPPVFTRQLLIPATRALRRARSWRRIVTWLAGLVALVLGAALVLLRAIGPGLLGDKTPAFAHSPVDLLPPSDLSVPVRKPLDLRAPPPDLVRSLPQAVPYAPDLAAPGPDGRPSSTAMPPSRLAQPTGTEGLMPPTVPETKPQTAPPRPQPQPKKRSKAAKRPKSARQPSFHKRSMVPRREES